MSVGGGEAQVGATWLPQIRETLFGRLEDVGPLAVRQRGLGKQGDGLLELGERSNLVARFDAMDVVGRDRHRADRLFVTFVTDVDDLVALLGAGLHLVVDLGDERTDRVDDIATLGSSCSDDLGGRAVGRKHDRSTSRHIGDVVDEDHAGLFEPLHHELVVHDLVVAVHRRFERPHHPGEGLDRHLDTGAKASRRSQQHGLNPGDG